MDIYAALAVPKRREMLELIAMHEGISASDIYSNFTSSPQAISQHLKVLREANLVSVKKQAQKRLYSINPSPFLMMDAWVQQMTQMWTERFDNLDKVLEVEKHKNT